MAELIKEFIRMNQFVKPEQARTVLDYECIVPDALPDIMTVLAVDGACTADSTEAENGRITVSFTAHYKILYLSQGESQTVKAITAQSSHTAILDAPGLLAGASVYARCCLEHIDHTVANSRKLTLRSVVKIMADANNTVELGVPVDVHDMEDVQLKKTTYTLSTVSENTETVLELAEAAELGGGKPSIGQLLRSDPSLCDITVTKEGGELQVKGTLTVCTLYEADGDGKKLEIIENRIPFTHTVPDESNPEEDPVLSVRSGIASFRTEVGEDSDGLPRVLDIRADIKFCITGYTAKTGEMLEDAYALSKSFTLSRSKLDAFVRTDEIASQFVLKEMLSLEEGAPAMKEVVNITGQIGQADITAEDGLITVEGYAVCNVLYITGDPAAPLASCSRQLPFVHKIDRREVTETASVPLQLYVSHTSFSLLSPSEMELRIAIAVRGEIIEIKTLTVITDMTDIADNTEEGPRPSILVYIVQPGDSLWSIGKRYNAPLETLVAINNVRDPELLRPGEKLLIPTGR